MTFANALAILSLRRLRNRFVGQERCFLDDHRAAVCELLTGALRRSLLALEVALQDRSIWNRIALELSREVCDLFLSQAESLQETLAVAGPGDERAEFLRSLSGLRHAKEMSSELDEEEVFGVASCGNAESMQRLSGVGAALLGLRLPHDDGLLVALVDYFFCRALQGDPVLGREFIFVHLEPVDELWPDQMDVFARAIEQQSAQIEALLRADQANASAVAIAASEGAFEINFQKGLDRYRAGEYEQAVAHFSAALRHDSACFPLYAYRGDALRLLCDYDGAIADYTAALKLNPNSATTLVQRANAHRLKGNPRQAVQDARDAIALDPNQAAAYLSRADAFAALAMHKQAIADYTVAIQLQPDNLWASFGRGKAFLQTDNYDAAIADFDQVLTLNPHFVLALLQRGDARRLKGSFGPAIHDYTEVLRHHPRNPLAYRSRAQAFALQGNFERAIADYTRALRLNATDAIALCNRGILHRRKGDLPQALIDLNDAVRCAQGNEAAFYHRGFISLTQGLLAEALADFNSALDCEPNLVAAYLGRALVHDRRAQFADAIQSSGRALQLDARCAAGYLIRGVIASHAARYDKAVTDLTQAIDLDPKFPLAYQERGIAFLLQGKHPQALADFCRLIELDPGQALAYMLRGTLRQLSGDSAGALEDFGHASRLDPKSILSACHPSLTDEARNRTTQLLADYIEGIRPKLPEVRVEKPSPTPRRKTIAAREGDRTTQTTMPALASGNIPRAADTMQAIAALDVPAELVPSEESTATNATAESPAADTLGEETAALPVQEAAKSLALTLELPAENPLAYDAGDVTPIEEEDSAAHLLLTVDQTESARPAETPVEAAPPEPVPAPLPPLVCLICRKSAAPYEKLAGGRVRCGNCTAVFLPGNGRPSSPRAGSPSSPAFNAAKTKPTKPKRSDEDDPEQGVTGKQKIVLSLSGAGLVLIFFYFYFPSFLTSGAEPQLNSTKVSADELLRDFTVNRVSAAKKYSASPIIVTGEVVDIISDKRPRIRFKRLDRKGGTVEAFFSHVNDLKDIHKDQPITVRGECEGWQKNVVEITLCKVVASEVIPR